MKAIMLAMAALQILAGCATRQRWSYTAECASTAPGGTVFSQSCTVVSDQPITAAQVQHSFGILVAGVLGSRDDAPTPRSTNCQGGEW